MLVDLQEQFHTPFYRHLLLTSDKHDKEYQSYIQTSHCKTNPKFIPSSIKGIMYHKGLSVSFYNHNSTSVDDMPSRIDMSGGWDKRNRKFNKVINHMNYKYYQMPWEEIQALTEEERTALLSERNRGANANSYGVADSIEQIYQHYRFLEASPTKYAIMCKTIYADNSGGWRWHKWGKYIGKHEIKCEYIADEVGIEKVIIFSVVEIKDKKPVYTSKDFDMYQDGNNYHIVNKEGELVCPLFKSHKDGRYYLGPARKSIQSYPEGMEADLVFSELLKAIEDFKEGKEVTFTDWE